MSALTIFALTTVINAAMAGLIIRWALQRERRVTAQLLAVAMASLREELIATNLREHGEECLEDVYHQMADVFERLDTLLGAVKDHSGWISGMLGALALTSWDMPNLGLYSKEYDLMAVVLEDNRTGAQRAHDRDVYGHHARGDYRS
jgi:hypothetical protein